MPSWFENHILFPLVSLLPEKKPEPPVFHTQKLGRDSGIQASAPTWGEFFKEGFGLGHPEERLIGERREQIQDAFSDVTLQLEWEEYKKDRSKDGYYTYAWEQGGYHSQATCSNPPQVDENNNSLCFETSEDWPDDVKVASAEMNTLRNARFEDFRKDYNAVRRNYERFKDFHGAVTSPHAGEGNVKPRCAEDGGTCPEWGKSFQLHFEGTLPDDPRDLKGEALDRFNRFMFQQAQEETLDAVLKPIGFIPFVGPGMQMLHGVYENWEAENCDLIDDETKRKACKDELHAKADTDLKTGGAMMGLDALVEVGLGPVVDVVGRTIVKPVFEVAVTPAFQAGKNLLAPPLKAAAKQLPTALKQLPKLGGGRGARAGATMMTHETIVELAEQEAKTFVERNIADEAVAGGVKGGARATADEAVAGGVKGGARATADEAVAGGVKAGARGIKAGAKRVAAHEAVDFVAHDVGKFSLKNTMKDSLRLAPKLIIKSAEIGALAQCAKNDGRLDVGAIHITCWDPEQPTVIDPPNTHLPHDDHASMYNDDLNYSQDPLPADAAVSAESGVGSGSSILLFLVLGVGGYYLYRKLT